MNTTVRTRRSGPRPAAADGSSARSERVAAGPATLPRQPVRPDPQASGQQAPSPQTRGQQAPARPARPARQRPATSGTPHRATSSPGPSSSGTSSRSTSASGTSSRGPIRTGAGGQVAGRSLRPAGAAASQATAAAPRHSSRTPFILLVIGLLAGGLACLLVINTTLEAGSYQIGQLQQDNTAASQRLQELQQQVSSEQSPASIQQRALGLGLRQQQVLNFVDLRTGLTYTTTAKLPPIYDVPGYTP